MARTTIEVHHVDDTRSRLRRAEYRLDHSLLKSSTYSATSLDYDSSQISLAALVNLHPQLQSKGEKGGSHRAIESQFSVPRGLFILIFVLFLLSPLVLVAFRSCRHLILPPSSIVFTA